MSGLCWQQLPACPLKPQRPSLCESVRVQERGKGQLGPRSCSSPAGPQEPRARWSVPLPGPRLLWALSLTGAERRASIPRRPPRSAVAPGRRSAAPAAGGPVAVPAPSHTFTQCGHGPVQRPAPRAVTHPGACVRLCSACPPPFARSLAGAACLCGPMTACVVRRLPALLQDTSSLSSLCLPGEETAVAA